MRLLDRPIAGYGYVHRGHAGSANPLPVRTHGRPRGRAAARASNVAVGEVMSSVGPGSARISSGPHAEIGLLRRRRIPLGPGIAARCESVLRSSYRTADPRRGARRIEPPTHAARRYAGIRALLAQLVEHFHGKEGVGGSSPPEGSTDSPLRRGFLSGDGASPEARDAAQGVVSVRYPIGAASCRRTAVAA